jgi:succinate dehydrogenase hydrophobic anchor subunit
MTNEWHTVLVLHAVIASCVSLVAAETNDDNETEGEQEEVLDERVIATFYILCAACISLVGVSILYFSSLEDSLMKRYKEHGTVVKASVVTSTFARSLGAAKLDCSSPAQDVEQEYVVCLEYRRTERVYYTVIIQKQVRATEKDFIEPSNSDSFGYVQFDIPTDLSLGEMSPCRRQMEILVLPGYSESGFPRRQIERACSWTYRASTVILVMCMFLLAGFCFHRAAVDLDVETSSWFVPAALFTMVALEIGLVHLSLRGLFMIALREEYLENGSKLEMNGNPSTLSSKGFVDEYDEYLENGSKHEMNDGEASTLAGIMDDDEDAASFVVI